jgi:hypothetical protein
MVTTALRGREGSVAVGADGMQWYLIVVLLVTDDKVTVPLSGF